MSNEIIDLIERTTVNFPTPLNTNEAKSMLRDLAIKGYTFRMSQKGFFNVEGTNSEDYLTKITGVIGIKGSLRLASISLSGKYSDETGISTFKNARFFTTPGYDWNEIPEDERNLIDSLRKDITDYLKRE